MIELTFRCLLLLPLYHSQHKHTRIVASEGASLFQELDKNKRRNVGQEKGRTYWYALSGGGYLIQVHWGEQLRR